MLIRKFREVASERIQTMSVSWTKLERRPDDAEVAAELLREIHTLKGEAKTVGFADLSFVARKLETLVLQPRDARFRVARPVGDVILRSIDALAALLRRSPDEPTVDLERTVALIEGAFGEQAALAVPVTSISDVTGELVPMSSIPAPGAEEGQRAAVGAKILLVEDSLIFRTAVSDLVKSLGHLVATAKDGVEAMEALESFAADLVITDIHMPRMDGFGLIRALHGDARFRSLPVVVLSSLGSPEDCRRASAAGASAYLLKTSPYLKNFIVARLNFLRFKRGGANQGHVAEVLERVLQ